MEKGWLYFPLDISELISAREQRGVPLPNRRNVAVRGRRERLAKISMMSYWLLACNFILCTKWHTRYHTIHNPQRPWTHTRASHWLLLVIKGESKAVCLPPLWEESLESGVFTPGLTPEGKARICTRTCTKTLGDIYLVALRSPPTSDICHSQSVQQATHISSGVLAQRHRGLQREKAGQREKQKELKTEQEGTGGRRQQESEKRAWKRQRELLLVVATLSVLIGSLETTPSVL